MKVYQDGKEVKGAEVIYDTAGNVDTVRVDGVHYAAASFQLKEAEANKQTKPAEKGAKKTVEKTNAPKPAEGESGVMTSEDLHGTNNLK